MSELESHENNLDNQLNNLLSQLRADAPPAGFTARTMMAIRPKVAEEPFRVHWSDFVPAFVLSAIGALALFVWLGAAGAHSVFDEAASTFSFDGISDIQLTVISLVIGLLIVAYPLLKGNAKRASGWFFSMI